MSTKTHPYDPFTPGVMARAGAVYEHQGRFYRAKFAHRMMDAAPPDKAHDLFDTINPR